MNVSEFTERYTRKSDDELLCMWADRESLVPEAAMALDTEIRRRTLNKEHAGRVKKRLARLTAREREGLLSSQIAAARNERRLRHFVGPEEPEFESPFGNRDIRSAFAYLRHRFRVWKSFRDHTGRWPTFSIWYHLLSWTAVIASCVPLLTWIMNQGWTEGGNILAFLAGFCALLGVRSVGAKLMRRLDWRRCAPGSSHTKT